MIYISSLINALVKANRASETEEDVTFSLVVFGSPSCSIFFSSYLQPEDHDKQCLASLKRLKRGDKNDWREP